jgi:hypothetical protein
MANAFDVIVVDAFEYPVAFGAMLVLLMGVNKHHYVWKFVVVIYDVREIYTCFVAFVVGMKCRAGIIHSIDG